MEVTDDKLQEALGNCSVNGFDKILITSHPKVINDSVFLANKGGIISYIGYSHGDANITINADLFHSKHLQLKAYDGPAKFFPTAKNLLERGLINENKFISHIYEFNNLQEAIKTAAEDKASAIKVIIKV